MALPRLLTQPISLIPQAHARPVVKENNVVPTDVAVFAVHALKVQRATPREFVALPAPPIAAAKFVVPTGVETCVDRVRPERPVTV